MSNSFNNIPEYVRILPKWVVWRYEQKVGKAKPDKIPYNARTLGRAMPNIPSTWHTLDEAIHAFTSNLDRFNGIGFMQSDDDNITIIDIDVGKDDFGASLPLNPLQIAVLANLPHCYVERSPSGRGYHIVAGGKVPRSKRCTKNHIEMYRNSRFMTFTGSVFQAGCGYLNDDTSTLVSLWTHIGGKDLGTYNDTFADDRIETLTDSEIWDIMRADVRWPHFSKLANSEGEELERFNAQFNEGDERRIDISGLDQGLVNELHKLSRNYDQTERMWLSTRLGNRAKTHNREDYRRMTIATAHDEDKQRDAEAARMELNKANMMQLVSAEQEVNQPVRQSQAQTSVEIAFDSEGHPVIPGYMGRLIRFGLETSVKPIYEVALCGARGTMSGICGRSWNTPSRSGINEYTVLLAKTGIGKDGMSSMITRLLGECAKTDQRINNFIGPSGISSLQSLRGDLGEWPSFVSILGEVGFMFQAMVKAPQTSPEFGKMKFITDIWGKSGDNSIGGSSKADRDKKIAATFSPAFSFVGDSTPDAFFKAVTPEHIKTGVYPRLALVSYDGDRPYSNYNTKKTSDYPDLIQETKELALHAIYIKDSGLGACIPEFGYGAEEYYVNLDRRMDDEINKEKVDYIRELKSRYVLKVLRFACLISIGVNAYKPVLEISHIKIAEWWESKSLELFLSRIESGNVGEMMNTSTNHQLEAIKGYIRRYFEKDIVKHKFARRWKELDCVPKLLFTKVNPEANEAFSTQKPSPRFAIEQTIKTMQEAGMISTFFKFGDLEGLTDPEEKSCGVTVFRILKEFHS